MKKKIVRFSMLPVIAASIFYSFSTKEAIKAETSLTAIYTTSKLNFNYTVSADPEFYESLQVEKSSFQLGKSYFAFKEAMGFKESGGDYAAINDFGYMGKYQFGRGTLDVIGVRDTVAFLNSPRLQEAAFDANTSRNKWILRRDINRFEDDTINGIKTTESGILAAAHLAGPGNVKKYLRSGGSRNFKDGFGTSIRNYFIRFEGYDTSVVKPVKLPKARIPSEV